MPGFLLSDPPVESLDAYLAGGGVAGLAAAHRLGSEATIDEVFASGLRGRGGGGFPTGVKWRGIATAGPEAGDRYVVCNAAEGEPGTFKDRALMRANPWQLVEGVAIAAFAVGAREAYIAMKASFNAERAAVETALAAMTQAGVAGDVPIRVVTGPEEYLFGEEKAMLEVIEGRDPLPRLFPPYLHGLFAAPQMGWTAVDLRRGAAGEAASNPTLVNNAETLSTVPHILREGPSWFRTMGTPASPGTTVVTVVGDVARPCVVEVELGTPLDEVLHEHAGGPRDGRWFKAALSGVANPVLPADRFAVPLTYEDMVAAGSGLGSAGFIVHDDTACMVHVALAYSNFLAVESCGQCPPCKLGSSEITLRLDAIEDGRGTEADVDAIGGWLRKVTDGSRCYLATEERELVSSVLRCFPEELLQHIDEGRCPRPREVPVPKIVDLGDGRVSYDEAQSRKLPDWTYAPPG